MCHVMTAAIARSITCAVLLAALATPIGAAARDDFWSRVWPAVAMAPVPLRIEVFVRADEGNRVLSIVADSGEYLRSSTINLDGAKAPRFHTVVYRSMPAGRYEVSVKLWDRTGTVRATERHWVDLVG
jgi:hypothetical protein